MKRIITTLGIALCLNTNAQIITTIAGDGTNGYTGDGGQATVAELSGPQGVAFDAAGNLYTANASSNTIRKIISTGIVSTLAGNGTAGFSGDGGQATAAELNGTGIFSQLLLGVACAGAGNCYIADAGNNRVRMVNSAGVINTIAGTGAQGFSGDGGMATAATLYSPAGITFDAMGNYYIADLGNNRIRMVNTSGIINTIAGTGSNGYSGDGGQATAAQLYFPTAVAADATGNLFIADYYNNRIRMVSTAGIISTYAGNGFGSGGSGGYAGDGGAATAAELFFPSGVSLDAAGNLYIADEGNQRVRKVTTSGIITTVAGNGTNSFSGDGGQATAATFHSPTGTAIDAAGNLYIADEGNERIRMVSKALTGVSTNSPSICIGATATLTASGASTYSWSTGVTAPSINPSPSLTAYYTVTGTNTFTAFNTTGVSNEVVTATVTVDAPSMMITGNNTICSGQSTVLSGTGASIVSYTWSSGPTAQSYTVSPTANTTYTLTGADVNTCENIQTVIVYVNPLPTVSANSATVCEGTTATLIASGANTYTWSNSTTGTPISVTPTVTTNYTVTGTDANSCVNTATATVTVTNCTDIQQFADNISVNIYPNPNCGQFIINSTGTSNMQIVDALGNIICQKDFQDNVTVSEAFPNGIYYIVVKNSKGSFNSKLIITR